MNIKSAVEIVRDLQGILMDKQWATEGQDEALQTLIDFYKRVESAKMPKKKKCICNKENLWKCDCGAEVYNQCISNFHKEG